MLNRRNLLIVAVTAALLVGSSNSGWAQGTHKKAVRHTYHVRHVVRHAAVKDKLVAYDAKDKRYYSVAWAKAHGMHDRGGDRLIIIRKSRLPKSAKLSHAMKGIEP